MNTVLKARATECRGEFWNEDTGTYHATRDGYGTLCGYQIGSSAKGWLTQGYERYEVSCKRCLKRIAEAK